MKHTAAGAWTAAAVLACGTVGSYAQDGAAAPASTNMTPVSTNAPQRFSMRDAMSFQTMDTNKDGKVTLEEYQAAMAAIAKQRFESMDTNKDGSLTEAELNAGRTGGFRRPDGAARSRGGRDRGDSAPPAKTTEGGAAQ